MTDKKTKGNKQVVQRGSVLVELSTQDVVKDGRGIPTSLKIFSVGDNMDCRGLNAVYDPERADSIMDAITRGDGTVPIDIAHGMVNPFGPPEMNEQYGEGTLRCDDTGIWLDDISWQDYTVQKLLKRAYRYISPTFMMTPDPDHVDDMDRGVISEILTVSLTNIPATVDAVPIVNEATDRILSTMASKKKDAAVKVEPKVEETEELKNVDPKAPVADAKSRDKDVDGDDDEGGGDKDDGDKGDEDDGDDKDVDMDALDSIELDELTSAQMRALCEALMNEVMESRKSSADKGDSDADKSAKRALVNALFKDCYIKYSDKTSLMNRSFKDVKEHDAKLRADAPKRSPVKVREKPYTDAMSFEPTAEALAEYRKRTGLPSPEERIANFLANNKGSNFTGTTSVAGKSPGQA